MRKIIISIALVALMLTGCSKNEGKTTAVESIATDTVATIGDASADATTEAALEVVSNESKKPEAVPATTEIGGGKKKAEETTEEKKPNTTESTKPSANHSNSVNSGSASSGQSTTPKPSNSGSNSGNSGNSGSSNSGNSNSTSSPKPPTPATTEAPTTQHQHNYNVWVKTKDAWDEEVIDQAAYDETIEHPAEYKTVPAVRCNTCLQKFASADEFSAHKVRNGGWCTADGYGTTTMSIMTKDAWTETKHYEEKSHVVHHDEEGYWACSCGARK